MTESGKASRTRIILAFAAIYVIWGSTYLAIRYAIETMPPFLMAGTRFAIAGLLMYGWARLTGKERPEPVHWRSATIVGALLLLGGNGAVVWAETRIPSGIVSLLIATVPLWMVILGRQRPDIRVIGGIGLGFLGLALLLGPDRLAGAERIDLIGAGVVVTGALSWAAGSLYSRKAPLPKSPLLGIGMQMMMGGLTQIAAGTVLGEWPQFRPGNFSPLSTLAYVYLILAGSLVGFTAYVWLLRHVSPSKVATYAYVNPVVAVLLGWGIGGEELSLRVLLAAGIIVSGVVLITSRNDSRGAPESRREEQKERSRTPAGAPNSSPTARKAEVRTGR
jgi:drug/metabolite transporter (DMT)-like permease